VRRIGTKLTLCCCALAAFAVAPSAVPAFGRQVRSARAGRVAPLAVADYLETYYENTVAPWRAIASGGAMNNIAHLTVAPHSLVAVANCNMSARHSGNFNSVRLIRSNLRGDYEISCQNGDEEVQHNLIPHKKMCYLTTFRNCPDMRFGPALADVGSEAAGSVGIAAGRLGSVSKVVVDESKGQGLYVAHVFYSKKAGGRSLEELTFTVDKGRYTHSAVWY
jgi:hypothetical protein